MFKLEILKQNNFRENKQMGGNDIKKQLSSGGNGSIIMMIKIILKK